LSPNQLTFLSEELPASPSQSLDSERDWTILAATSPLSFLELLTSFGPDGWSGKTSPVSCHPAEDGTLVPSSGRWANSGTGGPTGCWTLSTSEHTVTHTPSHSETPCVRCRMSWRLSQCRAVLFEREGLRRNPPPRREAGQRVAPAVSTGAPFSRTGNERVEAGAMVAEVANPLTARMHKGINTTVDEGQTPIVFDTTQMTSAANRSNPKPGDLCHPLAAGAHPPAVAYGINARQDPDVYKDRTGPIDTDAATQAVAFPLDLRNAGRDPEKHDEVNRQGVGVGEDGEPSHTLSTACVHGVATSMAVRRLTPTECERLQGFPDGWTNVPWRKKDESPDGPRYKALGNSMAVNVMRWIGDRIAEVDAIEQS
jgi:hypothetical protein